MAGYIYMPIATPEMLDFAEKWRDGQRRKGKIPYELLYSETTGWRKGARLKAASIGLGRGVLEGVASTDKVYILAHGNPAGSRNIAVHRQATRQVVLGVEQWVEVDGTQKLYNAVTLANLLKREGLPLQFQDLRVFACGSGNINSGVASESFAQGLAQALRDLGYGSIRVSGYMGSTWSHYAERQVEDDPGGYTLGSKHKGVENEFGQIVRASTRRVSFP